MRKLSTKDRAADSSTGTSSTSAQAPVPPQDHAAAGAAEDTPLPSQERPWLAHYPPSVSWDMEIRREALHAQFAAAVSRFARQPAIDFYGARMSYAELGRKVDQATQGLQRMGVGKGTRVALLLPNTPSYIIMYFAILQAGGTVVNCNPLYTEEELAHQIADSGAEILVTLDLASMFDKVEGLLASGALSRAIVCSFVDLLPTFKAFLFVLLKSGMVRNVAKSAVFSQITLFEDLVAGSGVYTPVAIDPDEDVAVIQYTGGTTGTPKGAMLTHANLSANLQQTTAWASEVVRGRQTIMGILPFFHVFGMTSVMNFGLTAGSLLILAARFEVDQVLQLIHRHRPTVMPGVPTIFNAILHHPKLDQYDLSSLRFGVSGGAPLPVEVKRRFEALTASQLVEGYGLSETSPLVVCNPINGIVKPGSIGIPVPRTEVSIRALEDITREVPYFEKGEICVKGPQVMKCYWNKPQETAESFIDGYFRTGDIGYMDEDGFIFIVDRLKDMINASGYKIYPRQVEEAIYAHPAVEEVTVVGIKDAYRGEAPKAFIKLKDGETASAEEILDFLRSKLSKIELPQEIEFRDELPKTLIGKLSKKELREEAAAQAAAQSSASEAS